MDQQSYLQRLRSIREKYGCKDIAAYTTSHYQAPHLKIDFHNPEHLKGPFEKIYTKPAYHLQERERSRPLLTRQYEVSELKVPRSFSVNQKFVQTKHKNSQFNEAQLKRQENFTNFIKDLDTRIQEKEKMLSLRFKENQMIIKKTENYGQTQSKPIQRYNSHRDIKTVTNAYERIEQSIPRNSYQRSSELLSKKTNIYENRQNDANFRLQASPSKKKYSQIMRQPQKLSNTSPSLLIQKKLEKNLVLNREGWNPNKLQSIQQRIKSVLKQSNN